MVMLASNLDRHQRKNRLAQTRRATRRGMESWTAVGQECRYGSTELIKLLRLSFAFKLSFELCLLEMSY